LGQLPVSCWDSAEKLLEQGSIYREYDVFPQAVIDGVARKLKAFNDKDLRSKVECNREKVIELVNTYFHCG
jgi:glutamine synthetase